MLRLQRNIILVITVLSALLFLSCSGSKGQEGRMAMDDSITFRYAQLIHIYNLPDSCRLVVLDNPWNAGKELHRYVLVPRQAKVNDDILAQGTVVRTPLQRTTVFTSVHCRLLQDIGALDLISGVCDFEYVQSPEVILRVREGRIGNMGSALNPNIERILSGHTDGMLVSPFEQSGYGTLERTGIPLIECADYMEPTALGRAEWVRFFGLLFGRERQADSLFHTVESNYKRLCLLVQDAKERPRLLCDQMNGAAWYVPGGQSTIGQLYQDAGADYLFADRKESGSMRLSFETVFSRGHDADIWFVKYSRGADFTYTTFAQDNPKYTRFAPYKNRRIYGCNTFITPFYDEEPFHPDLLLADAIHILHPDRLPDHQLHFFKPFAE